MANQEQLELLTRSVGEWNLWRWEQPDLCPDLSNAVLSNAALIHANLYGVNFRNANLTDAQLGYADLGRTILIGANLSNAFFGWTNLTGAYLRGADLTNVRFLSTIFAEVDVSIVKGLGTALHMSHSIVDINTVIFPLDKHTRKHFLRGVGFSDTVIDYLPSILIPAIEYHSLFLSHSHHDQAFTKRLHNDLQNKGVRCWFAPHDLRPIVRGIEEAIHLHEKLLLILSHHALMSNWVQQEVEAAFYKEVTTGQEILFPIRLDNTVLESDTLWAKRLCQRHVGDFTNWQDDSAYQQAFTTLLRHLKVGGLPTP
jgi:hypothetical protein